MNVPPIHGFSLPSGQPDASAETVITARFQNALQQGLNWINSSIFAAQPFLKEPVEGPFNAQNYNQTLLESLETLNRYGLLSTFASSAFLSQHVKQAEVLPQGQQKLLTNLFSAQMHPLPQAVGQTLQGVNILQMMGKMQFALSKGLSPQNAQIYALYAEASSNPVGVFNYTQAMQEVSNYLQQNPQLQFLLETPAVLQSGNFMGLVLNEAGSQQLLETLQNVQVPYPPQAQPTRTPSKPKEKKRRHPSEEDEMPDEK